MKRTCSKLDQMSKYNDYKMIFLEQFYAAHFKLHGSCYYNLLLL